jgi:LytS/YehU family sensor histidine kinase
MNKESEESLAITIAFALLMGAMLGGIVIGLLAGKSIGIHLTKTEAVEAGHGRWVVSSNGTTAFEWIKK